ncbi:hypothetical protein [Streptomyces noursei]|uniref:hypothetical protein n=1 Tax=Streptomyces noursei TaxID=1971 RepID=UPI00167A8957|nr:hypothetical protein [Streptomyces noursei]MCZ1020344.1 hypothetical protein [Streptomyces noursei]GGX14536.1 hypothetical protein GCM10010341_40250 [Streptomyces noursei]
MAETRPHITVSHHDRYGVVAATSHDSHVADHMLRRVGFEHVPGSNLYALTEPNRDPTRRGRQAVQSLRAAQYTVASDAAYDLHPHTPLTTSQDPGRVEKRSAAQGPSVGEAAFASARALDADMRAAQIVVHDQVRDREGTLRAVGTDVRTREGLLLSGEGDLRYVESRLEHTGRAFDAFYSMPGIERRDPRLSMMQRRAQAATAISPARAGVALPQQPAAAVAYRPATATRQPVRAR